MPNDKKTQIRVGADASQDEAVARRKRQMSGGEITSNGVFTKVLRDGHVEIVPTSEIYTKDPEDRVQGVEVQDETVAAQGRNVTRSLQDKLEMEFNTQEQGDNVSKKHAQGAAGTVARETDTEVERDEGAYDEAMENEDQRREEASESREDTQEADGGFDAGDPESTPLSSLEGAIAELSDAEVKKAQKKDSRKGAKDIYKARLSGE